MEICQIRKHTDNLVECPNDLPLKGHDVLQGELKTKGQEPREGEE